jgi:hypothetical protein
MTWDDLAGIGERYKDSRPPRWWVRLVGWFRQ